MAFFKTMNNIVKMIKAYTILPLMNDNILPLFDNAISIDILSSDARYGQISCQVQQVLHQHIIGAHRDTSLGL